MNYYFGVYDGDGELVNYFDTADEALDYVFEFDPDGEKEYVIRTTNKEEISV